jgi:hypothetical protein
MLAFETFALDPGFRNPYSSNSPIIKWHQEPATPTSSMHPDFDPLVGKYPPLREIVEPYIKFGRKNPSLVKAEALSRVQQQLDTLQALSRSHAAMERNFDWRVKEQGLLGTLRADPAKGLAMLKEEIAERKKADSNDRLPACSGRSLLRRRRVHQRGDCFEGETGRTSKSCLGPLS